MGFGVPFLSLQQLAIILSKKNAASSHSVPFCENKGIKLSNQPKMIPHSKSINFPFLPKFLKNLQIVLPMTSKTQQLPASYFGSPRSGPHPSLPYPCLSVAPQPVASTEFAWSFLVVVWWCIWRFIVLESKVLILQRTSQKTSILWGKKFPEDFRDIQDKNYETHIHWPRFMFVEW